MFEQKKVFLISLVDGAQPTDYFIDLTGTIVYGQYDNYKYFYVLCNDGITWCPEPVIIKTSQVCPLVCEWPRKEK